MADWPGQPGIINYMTISEKLFLSTSGKKRTQLCRATLSPANMAETAASFGRVMKCYGMHWTCIERQWPPEIAVERSRMSRKRRIAVDKPPDMLGVCEKIG